MDVYNANEISAAYQDFGVEPGTTCCQEFEGRLLYLHLQPAVQTSLNKWYPAVVVGQYVGPVTVIHGVVSLPSDMVSNPILIYLIVVCRWLSSPPLLTSLLMITIIFNNIVIS